MRYTPSERQAHLDLWRESGLSKAAYCRQADLPYRCLISWSRQSKPVVADDPIQPGEGDFIELERPSTSAAASPGVTVDLGLGRRLTIAVSADPEWAGRLLGTVFGC
jgi:hypothetical protein